MAAWRSVGHFGSRLPRCLLGPGAMAFGSHPVDFPGSAGIRSAWRPAWFGLMRIFPPFPPHRALQIVIGHWSLVRGQRSEGRGPRTTNHEPPGTKHQTPSTKHHLPPTTYHLPPTAYRLPPTAYRLPPTDRSTDAPTHRPPLFSDPRVRCWCPPGFGEAEREEKSPGRAGVCPMVRDARWVFTAAD